MRQAARAIFLHALREASLEKAFARYLEYSRGVLRIVEDLYNLQDFARVLVVAMGKAAPAMAEALSVMTAGRGEGIVVAPSGAAHASQLRGFRYFHGGHPLPDPESLRAADAILRALASQSERSLVIYLISGGASSMVEKPVNQEISLADLAATYRALVLSGAPIAQINAIRKHLSAVKGGRMALAAKAAMQVSVMVSDVPENALDALASGPTMPDSTTVEDCYAIAGRHALLKDFPASVRALFEGRALEETPKAGDAAFKRARWWPVLSNAAAQKAAAAEASASGFAAQIDNTCDDWEYARAADYLLARVRQLRRGVSRVCLISGGEVTVRVEGPSGRGGRNQQFALYCAQKISPQEDLCVLSAGTDGIDGNSPAAGAVADATTAERARSRGLDAALALARFDAYPLFSALGDAIETGPTGNNVRDLRILLAY